ncbi:MarR family winged helix-turn-helix transcriptional regulator [Roseibium sp.]|uniref:MarR family winged helix-turn-helix transcriptional regulator n=1 Tax=Roseibium sp. TaxID=1936156 RepID=UPI003A982188
MKSQPTESVATLMIVDIARLLRKRFEIAMTHVDTGLTVAEARTLAFIDRYPGLRQAALAERMSVEPMTLVGYLDSLESAGLVARVVDPSDRRAKLVNLTDKCTPVIKKIDGAITKVRAATFSGMTEEERQQLESLLGLMKDNLLSEEADPCLS